MKGRLVIPKNFGKISSLDIEPKKKPRKPIKSKIRRQLTTERKKCMWCRKAPTYEIHHIDGNRSNNSSRNLIGLCANCHRRATYGEITKEQLRKRLGIKAAKRKSVKRRIKRTRTYSPLEAEMRRQQKIFSRRLF